MGNSHGGASIRPRTQEGRTDPITQPPSDLHQSAASQYAQQELHRIAYDRATTRRERLAIVEQARIDYAAWGS
jgi:hypothetical protein